MTEIDPPLPSIAGFDPAGVVDGLPDDQEATVSPEVAYSLACHFVRNGDVAGVDPASLLTTDPAYVRLRRLLQAAFVNPDYRAWAPRDPELAILHAVPEFQRLAGSARVPLDAPKDSDIFDKCLEVDALDGFAAPAVRRMKGLGITTLAQLKQIKGSPRWTRMVFAISDQLDKAYGFNGDPARIESWLTALIAPPPAPKKEEKPETPPEMSV